MNKRAPFYIVLIVFCLAFSQLSGAFVVYSQSSCDMQDVHNTDNMQMTHHNNDQQSFEGCCDADLSDCCSDNCNCAPSASTSAFISTDADSKVDSLQPNRLAFVTIMVSSPDIALPKRPPIFYAS